MESHIYKIIEVTGTSEKSQESAIQNAIKKAAETIHNMRWFTVSETRGDIDGDHVAHWQVTVKVGFRLD